MTPPSSSLPLSSVQNAEEIGAGLVLEKCGLTKSTDDDVTAAEAVCKEETARRTVVTWNINGLRAVQKKGGLDACVQQLQPDILCLQEIRCDDAIATQQLLAGVGPLQHVHWACSTGARKGYSGTASPGVASARPTPN
jgi:hypothetical protein